MKKEEWKISLLKENKTLVKKLGIHTISNFFV
mgnify:CR=1 FL=1